MTGPSWRPDAASRGLPAGSPARERRSLWAERLGSQWRSRIYGFLSRPQGFGNLRSSETLAPDRSCLRARGKTSVFPLTPWGPVTINTAHGNPCPPAGRFCPPFFQKRTSVDCSGGVPEWLKGTDCKSVGLAYVGSNPTPSTRTPPHELAGVA